MDSDRRFRDGIQQSAFEDHNLGAVPWAPSSDEAFGGAAIAAASVAAVLAVGNVATPAFAATTVSANANLISNSCLRRPSLLSGTTVRRNRSQRSIPSGPL